MNFGNLQGLINGTEQVVFDSEITGSAVASVSTGNILNGDEDGWYTIIVRHIGSAVANVPIMQLNADSGTNYGYRGTYAQSTSVANASGTGNTFMYLSGASASSGYTSFSVTRLYAKSGTVRMTSSTWLQQATGTTIDTIYTIGQVWSNTADNITNINFLTSGAGTGLGVGTRIIILKSNNFTNGTPTGIITTPYIKGAWVRVGSSVLGAPATTVTFYSLDGDRDVLYYLSIQKKSGAGSDDSYFRPNNDSGSNKGYQNLRANSTTVAAARGTGTGLLMHYNTNNINEYAQVNAIIFAKSGFVRPMISSYVAGISGTTVTEAGVNGLVWNDTSNNMTSFVIFSTATNGFGTGSQFELYALRPNG